MKTNPTTGKLKPRDIDLFKVIKEIKLFEEKYGDTMKKIIYPKKEAE